MKKVLLVLCLIAMSFNFAFAKSLTNKDLIKLYKMMQGFYSSQAQSERDSAYFNIKLKMVPIWGNKPNEYWLYVEQAMSTAEDKPYRQRIYQLQLNPDGKVLTSSVYTIKNGEQYNGAWKNAQLLSSIKESDLELRNGCTIFLTKNKRGYSGSTNKQDCESNLRGAKYATSIVTISKKRIVSWDQGFDTTNTQVWGATKGGYEFKKLN